jgi:hypothetical protein
MQTLIIGSSTLKTECEQAVGGLKTATWVDGLEGAMRHLEVTDIDAVVFDLRNGSRVSCADLKKLIARTSVTTRVLAIVERLPDEQIFSESGVIYLTPPVDLHDIDWFIRSATEAAH